MDVVPVVKHSVTASGYVLHIQCIDVMSLKCVHAGLKVVSLPSTAVIISSMLVSLRSMAVIEFSIL
jgi:hypothetical protein